MKKTRITSMRNDHYINVRKMCASCHHKTVDIEGERICELMQQKVQQRFKCRKWQMSDPMRNVGKGLGMVKRHEYLMMVFEVRMQEREAIENGILLPEDMATLDSLRKRFEAETGLSPFVIR